MEVTSPKSMWVGMDRIRRYQDTGRIEVTVPKCIREWTEMGDIRVHEIWD